MNDLYKKLANEVREVQVSPELEARVLKEFRKHRVRQALPPVLLALAACLIAGIIMMPKKVATSTTEVARVAAQEPTPAVTSAIPVRHKPKRKIAPAKDDEPQFFRIPFSAPLAAYERAEIVRVEVPLAALAASGIHITTEDTSARAQADVLIGEDGMAHALRIISISN